jgi:hypothetical protein
MTTPTSLFNLLITLATKTQEEVNKALAANLYPPFQVAVNQQVVQKVEYLNPGGGPQVTSSTTRGSKLLWPELQVKTRDLVAKGPEFVAALDCMGGRDQQEVAETLKKYVDRVVHHQLYPSAVDVSKLAELFIADLEQRALRCTLRVRLSGILCPSPIRLTIGDTLFVLRPVAPNDLHDAILVMHREVFPVFEIPTAMGEIDYLTTDPADSPKQVESWLALLRLYRPGSIHFFLYRKEVESVTRAGVDNVGGSPSPSHPLPMVTIAPEEGRKFEEFARAILPVLDPGFCDPEAGINSRVIAFQRYVDALLTDGVPERRIANAMMGLESLYMADKDLSGFKISHRSAKVLGLMGRDPLIVRETIQVAYEIRSTYAHGDILSADKRKRAKKKLGKSYAEMVPDLLEYLRLSIIVHLLLKKSKKEFLMLIDKSWIHGPSDSELTALLTPISAVLAP